MVWWRAYNRLVDVAPLRMSMVSSAVLWSAGDLTAQHVENRVARPPAGAASASYNWRRTAVQVPDVRFVYNVTCMVACVCMACAWCTQTAYASLLWAPAAHYWYALLDRRVLSVAKPGSRRLVAIKLAAEMVALHPVSLVACQHGSTRRPGSGHLRREAGPRTCDRRPSGLKSRAVAG